MAKRTKSYPKWGLIAIVCGAALTAIEVVGAVSYLLGQSSPSYLVAGGALVTVVAAIIPLLAGRCWQGKRYILAALLWVAMVPALSLVFSAAVERTGGAKDEANRDRQAIAQRIGLTRAAEKEAKADVEAAEAKAAAECSRASKGVNPDGPLCKAAEKRAEDSRKRLKAARDDVAQAGVVPRDPQTVRLAAILPGITEEAIALYQPLVLPVSISALGLLLIAAGAHVPKPKKVKARRGKRKRRRRYQRKTALPSQKQASNVLPMRRRA